MAGNDSSTGFRRKLILENGKEIVIRSVGELCYASTVDGCPYAYLQDGSRYAVATSLARLSETLNPDQFIRINRQTLVNIDYIDSIGHGAVRAHTVRLRPPYSSVSFDITAETKKKLLRCVESGPAITG